MKFNRFLDPVRGLPRLAPILATARGLADSFTVREAALARPNWPGLA